MAKHIDIINSPIEFQDRPLSRSETISPTQKAGKELIDTVEELYDRVCSCDKCPVWAKKILENQGCLCDIFIKHHEKLCQPSDDPFDDTDITYLVEEIKAGHTGCVDDYFFMKARTTGVSFIHGVYHGVIVGGGGVNAAKFLAKIYSPDWDEWTCNDTARHGMLDCLKYAHENGCPWDEWTCNAAACSGYLECLKYAHENGCPWSKFTAYYAAREGHLDCLIYAHENGCPWDNATTHSAIQNGHFDCLLYAIKNKCPIDIYVTKGHIDFGERRNKEGFAKCVKFLCSTKYFSKDLIFDAIRFDSKEAIEIILEKISYNSD